MGGEDVGDTAREMNQSPLCREVAIMGDGKGADMIGLVDGGGDGYAFVGDFGEVGGPA